MVYCTKLHIFLLTLEKHMLAVKIKKNVQAINLFMLNTEVKYFILQRYCFI